MMLPRWMAAVALAAGAASHVSFMPPGLARSDRPAESEPANHVQVFGHMFDALRVMQDAFFEPWVGTWPSSIDWTSAVMGTHIAAAMQSVLGMLQVDDGPRENIVNLYFSHLIGYYFGQDAFSIRNQAYDDILWVVLGWLDAIQLVDMYNDMDLVGKCGGKSRWRQSESAKPEDDVLRFLRNQTWHGNTWSPAFAHRARVFWELATDGWDTELCGGGMTWNPALLPYKNAITNELFISASINMYLYFPGDANTSPFDRESSRASEDGEAFKPRDPRHLAAAVSAYKWLMSSGMRNDFGLYTDGFHISGYTPGGNNTRCDDRNEAVYTYNQGVLLSGQRGLFQVTGIVEFLEHGHRLVQDVIRATGWDVAMNEPVDEPVHRPHGTLPPWRGLGRAGVLEDTCDALGDCSQDGQTFKGIYMHHLAEFCAPLRLVPDTDAPETTAGHFDRIQSAHAHACRSYLPWLRHNAAAVLATKDSQGRFGMWWTNGLLNMSTHSLRLDAASLPRHHNVTDYRNHGVPEDPTWKHVREGSGSAHAFPEQRTSTPGRPTAEPWDADPSTQQRRDPNTRGRGRTVETQGGALQVLRAVLVISRQISERPSLHRDL